MPLFKRQYFTGSFYLYHWFSVIDAQPHSLDVIARYHLRKWQGKDIEIDPATMGLVTYLGYDN